MLDILRPHLLLRSITDVEYAALRERGIRAVLLDLDNTLTEWNSQTIPAEIESWVSGLLQSGLSACVVSNAFTARRVSPVAKRLGLPWVTRALKPFPGGFKQGIAIMGAASNTTAIIGDQMFSDILGGNCLGLYTILVEPISTHEAWTTRLLQRPLERIIGRRAKITDK